jgi:uncharacterized delta-60 repeat protein
MKNILTTITVLISLLGTVSGQIAGTLDPTFNGTGKVIYSRDAFNLYQDVKVQSDGNIVAVGTYMASSFMSSGIEVTRYLTDGTFDLSFGTNGHFNLTPYIESGAYSCIIKEDGKILVGGYTTDWTNYYFLVFQLNENGTLDPSFGVNGVAMLDIAPGEKNMYQMALQADKKILLAGYIKDVNFNNAPVVVRLTESGIPDTTFGTNGVATIPVTESDNEFASVCVQSDGKIVAAGHISNGLSWFSLLIARFDQNGQLDAGYGTGGIVNLNLGNVDDEFFDVKLTAENEAILTGFTVSQSDYYYHLLLMKFDASGNPVISFGLDGSVIYGDVPYTFGDAMVLQTDGKILVAGCTGALAPANNDWAIWRFNPDGSADNTFGTNGMVTTEFSGNADEALGIALHDDKIVVAGKARNATNYLDFAVARYDNDLHVSVPEITDVRSMSVTPNPVKRNGRFTLTCEFKQAENVSIELTSVSGSSVFKVQSGIQAEGKHTFQISLPSHITGGVYLLNIKGSQNLFETMKLVVIE